MSFQAKRLRVQLPCGEATVVEQLAREQDCDVFSNPNCPTIFDTCAGGGVTFPECAAGSGGCGETPICRFDSFTCPFETCGAGSPCGVGTPCNNQFGTPPCGPGSICRFGSDCGGRTVVACQQFCTFVTPTLCDVSNPCRGGTLPDCHGATDQTFVEPGRIVIDPEQLPVLRRQLEAQLEEIDKAEQALRERGADE